MEQSYYLELIGMYLTGEIGPQRKKELMEWVAASAENRSFFEETVRLWEAADCDEVPSFEGKAEQAWRALSPQLTNGGSGGKLIQMPSWRVLLRYAAAVLLPLALVYGLYATLAPSTAGTPAVVEVRTAAGEQQTVVLPDSSRVVMNERTVLAYSEAFAERQVKLQGEAFFEVKEREEQPFAIVTGGAETVVLGTSFNVRAYPEEPEVAVSVETGKVLVREKSGNSKVLLRPGESGVYNRGNRSVQASRLTNALAWKEQELVFEGTRLSEVAEVLKRYFGREVRVSNDALGRCRFNGIFENPKLEQLLEYIAFTMEVEVVKQDGGYLLKGNAACQ
jgi:transmembrane sensor